MPRYEFFCEDCQKPSEIILTLTEYEKDRIACPHVHQEAPKCSGTASANRNATESESVNEAELVRSLPKCPDGWRPI